MRKSVALLAALALVVSACAEPPKMTKTRAEMTQRERDSVIGASRLPGAGVVRKGMSISDAQTRRAAMLDSLADGN